MKCNKPKKRDKCWNIWVFPGFLNIFSGFLMNYKIPRYFQNWKSISFSRFSRSGGNLHSRWNNIQMTNTFHSKCNNDPFDYTDDFPSQHQTVPILFHSYIYYFKTRKSSCVNARGIPPARGRKMLTPPPPRLDWPPPGSWTWPPPPGWTWPPPREQTI